MLHGTLPSVTGSSQTRWPYWLALALLVIFAGRVIHHATRISATFDEPHHLAAGYTNLRWQDFRLNPEHPPLTKMVAALPLLALAPLPSDLDIFDPAPHPGIGSRSWQRIKQLFQESVRDYRKEWYLGHELIWGVQDSTMERFGAEATMEIDPINRLEHEEYLNDPERLIFWGRLPLLIFGLLLSSLVFLWARDLWGSVAGVFSLGLVTFDPNVVAHSTLITSDVAAAALILGSIYGMWRYRRVGGWPNAALALICFSLAFAVKFSAILLIPSYLILASVSSYRLWRNHRTSRALRLGLLVVGCGVGCLVALWAVYGFRYAALEDGEGGEMPVEWVLKEVVQQEAKFSPEVAGREYLGAFDRTVSFANRNQLLPESYLQGLAIYQLLGRVRPSFLRGEYSLRGFRGYFFWTFLLKTPLVTLLAILGSLVLVAPRSRWEDLLYLLVPAGLYFALAAASYLHIGNRHILPVYPFLFVLAGGLTPLLLKVWRGKPATAVMLAVGLVALSSMVVFWPVWQPTFIGHRPLEFFNEIGGGPKNGYKSLVDSNLDWGQSLKELAAWLEENEIEEPINLCYFGTADPRYYQIQHVRVPCDYLFAPPFGPDDRYRPTIVPGYLAISATHLQGERDTERMREMRWAALEGAELVDRIGNSIFIYRLGN